MKKLVVLLIVALTPACTGLPHPKTINDAARALCAIVMSEKQGISVEEAANGICAIPEILEPFLRETQAGAEKAGQEAAAAAEQQKK